MKKAIVTLAMLLTFAPAAKADWISDYVRYTDSPELGQIVIEAGRVRGYNSVRSAQKSTDGLSARNIFVGSGNGERRYKRTARYGKHVIQSSIVFRPPTGIGYGGANYSADLSVVVDGVSKVRCNLGYVARENNLHVEKIVIYPEDEYIEVVATAGPDNKRVSPPLKHCLFEDAHIINNQGLAYASPLTAGSYFVK